MGVLREFTMIRYTTSQLFDSPAQTLVNTVNTAGVMGRGVAAEFKRRYPDMYLRYRKFCNDGILDVGKLYLYRTQNKWVLNFPTKKHWRNPSKLEYVEAGLEKFVGTYTDHGITSVSFPQLGCGNGSLDWCEVRPLMEKHLQKLPIPTYIHIVGKRSDFVPEHIDANMLQQARQSRQDIGFQQFLAELKRAPQVQEVRETPGSDEDVPSLIVQLTRGTTVTLPGQDLEELWNSLRMRGALRQDEFPGSLREQAQLVAKLLLKLDYVEQMKFTIRGSSGREKNVLGVRYAPLASEQDEPTIAVEAT
jgi:O-acetyl-ADP-ribose deacetylase (regulator of RNase III)